MAKRTYMPERIINKSRETEVLVKDRRQLKTAGRSEQVSRLTTSDTENKSI